ncbi:MAG: hypothetical protein AB4290_28830 [Spirulina sp.]
MKFTCKSLRLDFFANNKIAGSPNPQKKVRAFFDLQFYLQLLVFLTCLADFPAASAMPIADGEESDREANLFLVIN